MNCYCYEMFLAMGKQITDIKFENGNYYCSDWYNIYMSKTQYDYYTSMAITVVNIIIKFILSKLGQF